MCYLKTYSFVLNNYFVHYGEEINHNFDDDNKINDINDKLIITIVT